MVRLKTILSIWVFSLIYLLGSPMPAFPASGNSSGQPEVQALHTYSTEELALLRSLSLASLPPLPHDPSNQYGDDPKARALGKQFFFDPKFSGNGEVSCATCHQSATAFTDLLPLAKGMGISNRRTMPLIGMAYNAWYFWDGRRDTLWAQVITPVENAEEHGFTRTKGAHRISEIYRAEYEGVFGKLPVLNFAGFSPQASPATGNPADLAAWNAMQPADRDKVNRIFANFGKAIAAFVRHILPQPAPFDRYVEAVQTHDHTRANTLISRDAVAGLRLFIGKAKCTNCHLGPLFTNGGFHNISLPNVTDRGRAPAIDQVLNDEFNCLGQFSDAQPEQCTELVYIDTNHRKYEGAFKTPSLRNVAERAPYMHAGQFKSLDEVLFFYRQSPSDEVEHQQLTGPELQQIKAFLGTLSGPISYPQ